MAERSGSAGGQFAIALFLLAALLFGLLWFTIDSNRFEARTGSARPITSTTLPR